MKRVNVLTFEFNFRFAEIKINITEMVEYIKHLRKQCVKISQKKRTLLANLAQFRLKVENKRETTTTHPFFWDPTCNL